MELTNFLPTTLREVQLRGWEAPDVILFSADAYVDHPAFGAAVVGRTLEALGLRVALVPQPNWRDDLRDFKKLGRPRLFFAVSGGAMDSMVNRYTARRRTRSEDAYSPDGRTDLRPDYATTVYARIIKQLYPDVPLVIGGIEASLRRFTHYDYWQDRLLPPILQDAPADLLIYGMGEQPLRELVRKLVSQAPSTPTAPPTPPKGGLGSLTEGSVTQGSQQPPLNPPKGGLGSLTDAGVTQSSPPWLLSEAEVWGVGGANLSEFMEIAKTVPQVAYLAPSPPTAPPTPKGGLGSLTDDSVTQSSPPWGVGGASFLHSHEACLQSKQKFAENFRTIEQESNKYQSNTVLIQPVKPPLNPPKGGLGSLTNDSVTHQAPPRGGWGGLPPWGVGGAIIVNPPFPTMTAEELDFSYDLPYTRLPHPKYKGKRIPAYEMIRHSVTLHRGCFGGCAFCTISAHQGKHIASRSPESILREVKKIAAMPDFKGHLTDLGGPSANMYAMTGIDPLRCRRCSRPSCIFPAVCSNLQTDHQPLLRLYRAVEALPYVNRITIGSGVRYDLILHPHARAEWRRAAADYARALVLRHTSGRLKVAPEHTEDRVLHLMRKPSFQLFEQFNALFERLNREASLRQQLIPYFISCHPGCTLQDMRRLAAATRRLHFRLEQVQEFTPTPMTLATAMYYTALDPYTMKPLFAARTPADREAQHRCFFLSPP